MVRYPTDAIPVDFAECVALGDFRAAEGWAILAFHRRDEGPEASAEARDWLDSYDAGHNREEG